MSESDGDTFFIPTKGSLLKKSADKSFEIVTFQSYKSTKPKKDNSEDNVKPKSSSKNVNEADEFNVKRARHEIIKFGMSGFDSVKKEEAKIQLAIKLGAKPPKNKYKNYKQLIEERKKQKSKTEDIQNFQQLGKNSMGKSTAKGKSYDRKRKKKDNILDIYGRVKKPTES